MRQRCAAQACRGTGGTSMADTLGDMIRERGRASRRSRDHVPGPQHHIRRTRRASNQVANTLRAAGIGRGDRVAILDKNVPEFFELLLGAAKLGRRARGRELAARATRDRADRRTTPARWCWSSARSSSPVHRGDRVAARDGGAGDRHGVGNRRPASRSGRRAIVRGPQVTCPPTTWRCSSTPREPPGCRRA